MSSMIADQRNAAEIAFWNGPGGRHWVHRQEAWDGVLAPVTSVALAHARVQPGGRVVDVGCGCGARTIQLGKLVGPRGRVLGLDISAPMLARAAVRLTPDSPAELVQADATKHAPASRGLDTLLLPLGV